MIYLASRSPRRRELLLQLGIGHERLDIDVDETQLSSEAPAGYVRRLALEKARAGHRLLRRRSSPMRPVLSADTAVVIDGRILGKPRDRAHALSMLLGLSGREHQVVTGVALVGEREQSALSTSSVRFRPIGEDEAAAYCATGEPSDKAGGYAIQGLAAQFVENLSGSYSGVMGLPLFETAALLRQEGIGLLSQRDFESQLKGKSGE